MVKANELRIGNWVDAGQLGYAQVATIKPTTEGYSMPIPITPEILVACGFEKDKLGWDKPDNNNIKLYQFKGNPIMMSWNEIVIGVQIHSLHQLQNLFFALTGEELNYKPLKL